MNSNKKKKCTARIPKNDPVLRITADVLMNIIDTVGKSSAETGGVLGSSGKTAQVSYYHFDTSGKNSSASYSPDHKSLNRIFKREWNPKKIRFRGFVHSHPVGLLTPSRGDEIYAERILDSIEDLECLLLLIVNTVPDTGEFKMVAWVVYRDKSGVKVVRGKMRLNGINEHSKLMVQNLLKDTLYDEISIPAEVLHGISVITSACHGGVTRITGFEPRVVPMQRSKSGKCKHTPTGKTFDRVKKAYDLNLLGGSRVIAVGAGGAASWIEELARAGVGQFVLIDPDVVSETNLATQQVYRRDIGRAKVNCIEERIIDINPTASVLSLQKDFFDINDKEFELMYTGAIGGCAPSQSIVCGLTDSFYAQARVNRLALKFGLPSLSAQVYENGRGAEVTFTYPGVTPACHRCILSSRYHHFLEEKQENPVTSHGSPIFATTRLNAIKGFVLLAMLHHGTSHPRWGRMLSRIGKRNLIQIRMDPDFAETIGINIFNSVFEKADKERLFFDEAVWLPQDHECPENGYPTCEDCGGTGDLRSSIGKFEDTRNGLTDEELSAAS